MKPILLRFGILIILLLLAACRPSSEVSSPIIPLDESPTATLEPTAAAQGLTPTVTPSVVEAKTRFEQCAQIETTPFGILRLAWIENGDLWLWDWGEAEPYSLTASGDVNALRFIKDGREIVFTRQTEETAEIWAGNFDGGNLRLLTDGQILSGQIQMINFSFDEHWLAFIHLLEDKVGELWVARLDGSEAKRLVSHADLMDTIAEPLADFATPTGVIWLPNTHNLIYDAYPGFDNGGIYIYVQHQNLMVNADSGTQDVLFPLGEGGQVSISPDGTALALLTPDDLRLMKFEDNELHDSGIDFFAVGFGEFYAYPPMTWTLDSGAVLVAQPAQTGYDQDTPVAIWQVPVTITTPALIAEFSGFFPTFSFSQDRSKIAYWRVEDPGSNQRELHIATLDGSENIVYETADLLDFLGWSPDLSFVYSVGYSPWETKLGEPCSDPILLDVDFYFSNLAWIHSTHFLFENRQENIFELYLGTLETPKSPILLLNLENFTDYDYVVLPENSLP